MGEEICITVKMLSSPNECKVNMSPNSTVLQLKEQVSQMLNTPIACQKITYRGRVLNDKDTLDFSGLTDGSKVHVVTVTNGHTNKDSIPDGQSLGEDIIKEMKLFLRPHFAEPDCKRIIDNFQKGMCRSVAHLSLDDIERLAWQRLDELKNR